MNAQRTTKSPWPARFREWVVVSFGLAVMLFELFRDELGVEVTTAVQWGILVLLVSYLSLAMYAAWRWFLDCRAGLWRFVKLRAEPLVLLALLTAIFVGAALVPPPPLPDDVLLRENAALAMCHEACDMSVDQFSQYLAMLGEWNEVESPDYETLYMGLGNYAAPVMAGCSATRKRYSPHFASDERPRDLLVATDLRLYRYDVEMIALANAEMCEEVTRDHDDVLKQVFERGLPIVEQP